MFSLRIVLCYLIASFFTDLSYGQRVKKFFRDDYTYVDGTEAFYKIHTISKTWSEAEKECELEGATLFYPENDKEASAIIDFWNITQHSIGHVFIGVSTLPDKRLFVTIDGKPICDVYDRWRPGEPNNADNVENCVVLYLDGMLNDVACGIKSNFICKKIQKCNTPTLYGKKDKKFFRKDYKYLEETEAFYKIHTIPKTWSKAKTACAREGATLFYPENDGEAHAVIDFWNSTQPFYRVYIGISAMLAQGIFETVDGKLVEEIYNNWDPGQPHIADIEEDCVVLKADGSFSDDQCYAKYPFICKKTVQSLEWHQKCQIPDLEYTFNAQLGRCYKFHMNLLSWSEAYAVCRAEQSYLAVINSVQEAEFFVNWTAALPLDAVRDDLSKEPVHLGFHNRANEGWRTFRGTPLRETGYYRWADQQPDRDVRILEQCGSMLQNGHLNQVSCERQGVFICEHEYCT